MIRKNFWSKLFALSIALQCMMLVLSSAAFAADGSGTNTVSPLSVVPSSTGNTETFTMTAAETMDSGGFTIAVPSGWSTPNSTPSTAGYTTVSSAVGVVANVLNTLDSISGWSANQHMALSADTGDKQEGTASLLNTITANAGVNEQWYYNSASTNWGAANSGNARIGMWLKSNISTAGTDLYWQDDNTANLASPEDTLAIAALTANTWKYTSVTLGGARSAQLSYGFRYTNDIGAATVKADSLSVIFDNAESITNWAGSDANVTRALLGSGQEGTDAIRCTFASGAAVGAKCRRSATGSFTIGPGTTVSLWIRSSVATNAGDLQWMDDGSTALGSPEDTVNIPALTANTWTYVTLTASNSANKSVRSYGINMAVDKGAFTVDVDALGKVINVCDSMTGWTAPTSALQTLSSDATVFHEGTGSLKNILAAGATAGDSWYQALGATQDWSGYSTIGFWIRSTVAANAGDLQFVYDDASDVSSPIGSINIGALSANTWTYQKLTLTGTRTSVNSFGIKYVTNIGATTINVDDILIGPGVPTFPGGGLISTRILSLASPQTIVVAYGSGGGSSGATAPSSPGDSTFITQTRSSDSGTLTNISSQPVVTVSKITTTTVLISSNSPEVYGTPVTFTATVTPASGGPATGTVTFKDGVTTIGTGTLSSGVATYSTSTLSVLGSPHSITAVYAGDSTFSESTSNVVSQTMTTKELTVDGITANNKPYDRGTNATLNTGGASLVGIVSGDTVTLNTGSAAGTFSDKTVADGKTVTISGLTLSGVSAGNYSVTQPTTTANITALALSVTGVTAENKPYDRGTTATLVTTSASLVGVISGDSVTLNTGSASGSFANKTVGDGKIVTVSGLTISGTDSGNYTLTQPTTTANITALALSVTGVTAENKPYDRGTTATLVTTSAALSGVISGDTVNLNSTSATGSFADKTVANGKTVTVSGFALSGTDSANYTVTQPSGLTANITALALSVTGVTAENKPYDRGTTATLVTTGAALSGVISGDSVTLNTGSASGSFANKTVGDGKTVTVSGLTISGTDSGNYTLTQPTTTANITALALSVTGVTAENKPYDRGTTATLVTTSAALSGVISGDTVNLNSTSATGSFADKTVANGKTVTVSGFALSGTDSANYTVTQPSGITANIIPVNLTVTGVSANNKPYDGNETATLNTGSAALSGVILGDTVTVSTSGATALFADKTVANGKTVTVSGLTLSGVDAGNYTLTQPTGLTANITALALTVTGITAVNKQYDGSRTAALNTGSAVLVGVISGDAVTLNAASVSALFNTKNVGTGKAVAVTGLALSGTDSGNYTLTQPSGITANITALELSVTGMTASNKPYDGDAAATLTGGTLEGIISPDVVSISARSGSFSDKSVADNKPVTVTSITLTGTDKDNYTVALPTGLTANIVPKTLTVSGMTAQSRPYDGGTTATLTGGSLEGIISPDVVSISASSASFANKTVANGKTVTVNSITLTGVDKDNYTVTLPTVGTANITALALTVTGMTAIDKEYDRGTTVSLAGGSLEGVISPDVVSIDTRSGSFTTKTVGSAKPITVTLVTLTGTDAGNYTVTNPTDVTGNITALGITVTGVVANDKDYDGDPTATLNTTSAVFVGVISGDIVTLNSSDASASFDTAEVGTGKPVTVSGLALSGTDGPNYTLSQPTGLTASIRNPVPVISSITPTAKGINDPGFTLTVNGSKFIASSVVSFNGSPRATTYVNAGQLTAAILASDLLVATSSARITVTNPAPGGGTSNYKTFIVSDLATQFVIIAHDPGTTDAPITVTVQAQKSGGAVDTTYQQDVTLAVDGHATGGGVVDIQNGVGTIAITDTYAETVHLSLSDTEGTGLEHSSTQNLVFTPGAIAVFELNTPGNMNARARLGYILTRKDQHGNLVTTGTQRAYLYSSSVSTDKKFYDDSLTDNVITYVDFAEDSSTANFWYYDDMPGTYTITVSETTPTANGLTGIDDATRDVTVIPVAVKFTILTASSTSVDIPLTVTVEARKVDDTVDTTFQDGVTLNADGSVTGDGLVTVTNGVGTKSLSGTVAETIHLTLIDSEATGLNVDSTATVVWLGGATTQFNLTHPATLSAGNRAAYTLSRKDQHGNNTSQGDITAYLYSSSGSINKKFYDAETGGTAITHIIIPAGQNSVSFWYYDDTPGTVSITASDGTPSANGATGISDAVDVLSVVPGPVASFTLNNAGDMTAKTRLGYTVTRKDQFGNLVTSGDTTAYLYTTAGPLGSLRQFYNSATDGAALSQVTISDGSSHSHFWYYEEVSGNYTVTASDNASIPDALGITDGTTAVYVSPAPIVATRFVIIPPSAGTVDSPITVTIQAQDDAGNIDSSATSSITLLTTGSATGGGLVTMSGGSGTIQISDHNAETVHLSLSDTEGTGLGHSSTADAVFSTGAAAQLFIDTPGDTAAGSRLGFTVTRKDQFGNLITSGITTVYLYTSSAGANKRFYDAGTGGSAITSVNILEGQSMASFWYYDELSGSVTVTLSNSDGGPSSGTMHAQTTFTVTPAALAKFLLNNPGNMTANTRLEYTLTRKDQFDNLVTSGVVSAYLYSNATGAASKFYDVSFGGIPITAAAFTNGSSQTNFWYYEEAPGTWVITASDSTPTANGLLGIWDGTDSVTVSLSPITATRFVIQPTGTATIKIPTTITVRAEDNNGNVDTTYNHNVTLVATGSVTGAGLVTITNGVGTIVLDDIVPETVTLSLVDSQATHLNVSSTQTLTFNQIFIPIFGAGGGGAATTVYATPVINGVHFAGRTSPGATLNIIAIGGTGSTQGKKSVAGTTGAFSIDFGNITGGARSYGIIGTDKNNNTTQVKIFDVNKANSLLQLDVNGILLSPTLDLSRTAVTKGDVLGIIGAAAPGYKIDIQVDNLPISVTATVDSKGMYKALIPTSLLAFGSHTIRTRQTSTTGLKSDYSPQKVFSVVNIFTPNLDFNSDGAIGVQDYSIFVSRWQSSDSKLRAKDDLNGDGKVDIQDLSIFVRTLKAK